MIDCFPFDTKDPLRNRAWKRFLALEAPKRYLPKGQSVAEPSPYVGTRAPDTILFYNGRHVEGGLALSEAWKKHGSLLKGRWNRQIKSESDPFAALNAAVHQEGCFLYVPPGEKRSLQLFHRIDQPALVTPRFQLMLGAGAEVDLKVTIDSEIGCWMNGLTDIGLEEGAQLKMSTQYQGELDAVRVTQKRGSRFQGYTFGSARLSTKIQLEGEGAEAELIGGWRLDGKQQTDVSVRVEHQAPNCRSKQLFKGVLGGTARSSFRGEIFVADVAQGTDAFQASHALLLSRDAAVHSEPNLEIFADEVKASHGATVGQLDREQLFYLRSRGMDEVSARDALVDGFLSEVRNA